MKRYSDGMEEQGAEEALCGQERIVTPVLEAVARWAAVLSQSR
jgi:hypothetical protein